MNRAIIVFYGLSHEQYEEIMLDILKQFKALGDRDLPIFVSLPADFSGVEVINTHLYPTGELLETDG